MQLCEESIPGRGKSNAKALLQWGHSASEPSLEWNEQWERGRRCGKEREWCTNT